VSGQVPLAVSHSAMLTTNHAALDLAPRRGDPGSAGSPSPIDPTLCPLFSTRALADVFRLPRNSELVVWALVEIERHGLHLFGRERLLALAVLPQFLLCHSFAEAAANETKMEHACQSPARGSSLQQHKSDSNHKGLLADIGSTACV